MKKHTVSPAELTLARSTRLQNMRHNQHASSPIAQSGRANQWPEQTPVAELETARQLIDAKLQTILSALPVGKQQRLFKIRYGVELADIKLLPLAQVFRLLGLSTHLLTKTRTIADLNYNGQKP